MTVQLVGILNLTPDSFSGDGLSLMDMAHLKESIESLWSFGADWIDFGAQRTSPGAICQDVITEQARLAPLWTLIASQHYPTHRFSIDTFYHEVAAQAIAKRFGMVNDVSGGRADPNMLPLIANHPVKYVMMYCKNASGFSDLAYSPTNIWTQWIDFFDAQLNRAYQLGVQSHQLLLDPGMGAFISTRWEDSVYCLHQIQALKARYNLPIYIGASRKGFLGHLTRHDKDKQRLGASIAAAFYAAEQGADFLRVHDVFQTKQFLEVYENLRAFNSDQWDQSQQTNAHDVLRESLVIESSQ